MAAHKRSIRRTCLCGHAAPWEVFNTFNGSLGYFCTPCANRRVKELNAKPTGSVPAARETE